MFKTVNKAMLVLSVLAWFAPLAAQEAAEAQPTPVYVGVYVNQVFDMSLKDNEFSVDFYVWFRWQGKEVDPVESFDVVNGRIDSKEGIYRDEIEGYNYASCRVVATVTKFWDIRRFPLDNHTLTIEIEDNDNEEFKLQYSADRENCSVDPAVQVPGWVLERSWPEVVGHSYKTNYGDTSLPTNSESVYSRFIYSINVVRPGYGYFLKLFFGVFIAALIAMLALFIKPTDLDPRFGLGVGALFAAVASEYVIASSLPDTNVLTMTDKLHLISILFIFLSIAESTLSLQIFTRGKEALALKIDRICLVVFFIVFIALNALAILLR